MNWLIVKQGEASNIEEEGQWLDLQAEFLKRHLLVWGPTCLKDLEFAAHADFYQGVSLLLRGFFEVENQLFEDRGPKKIGSLDQLRRQYGKRGVWKGPTFDPGSPEAPTGPSNDSSIN